MQSQELARFKTLVGKAVGTTSQPPRGGESVALTLEKVKVK